MNAANRRWKVGLLGNEAVLALWPNDGPAHRMVFKRPVLYAVRGAARSTEAMRSGNGN